MVRGAFVDIHVEDTGEGMDPMLLEKATDRFVRGDAVRHGGESTGLGLAIAKGIVQAHHCKLTIRSVPSKGTDVVISLRHR